ncbi:alpha/beta fold hydrolase [Candidatus Woesearchaeota archaeon]|nr:alpha/beta fold hydrolase [Candidatus Woesearchaeota archaeon]
MKKEVLVVLLLLVLPLVFAEVIIDQCYGNCPQKDSFNDFLTKFDEHSSSLTNQKIPEGLQTFFGDQKINVNVNDQTLGIEISDGKIKGISKGSFSEPSITASMDDQTFTSILNSQNKAGSIQDGINTGRIQLEGTGVTDKLKNFGGEIYSYFAKTEPQVEINPIACIIPSDPEQTIRLKRAGDIRIPEGNELIIPPFQIECEKDTELKLTLSAPNNYRDVKVLKCTDDLCVPLYVEKVEKLACSEDIVKVYKKQKEEIEIKPIKIPPKKQQIISNSILQSGSIKIEDINSEPVMMRVSSALEQTPEPLNPALKILGTPLVINVDKITPIELKLELPYVTAENIDPSSVSAYALKNNKWQFLGGAIDLSYENLNVRIKDLSEYLENNQAVIALIGWTCIECKTPDLKKIYTPLTDSRDAVVFVHGIGFSPQIFQQMIDDIRLTNQPWQVFTYDYPPSKTIQEIMASLTESLELKTKKINKIYLVGHSTGGILIQQALHFAEQAGNYEFLKKVKKTILIGTPNQGVIENLDNQKLLSQTANINIPSGLNVNNEEIKELSQDFPIPRVQGIEYKTIAGTKPYEFTKDLGTNDGIVDVNSAQQIGEAKNVCNDYWEVYASHEELPTHPETKKIVEKLISEDLLKQIDNQPIIGNQQYYELKLDNCIKEKIAVVGKKDLIERSPQVCSCGNGYCGWDENKETCYSDCGNILRKEVYCSPELQRGLLASLIILLILTIAMNGLIKKLGRRRQAFTTLITLSLITMGMLISIHFLCELKIWILILKVGVFAVLVVKLTKLLKTPYKKV